MTVPTRAPEVAGDRWFRGCPISLAGLCFLPCLLAAVLAFVPPASASFLNYPLHDGAGNDRASLTLTGNPDGRSGSEIDLTRAPDTAVTVAVASDTRAVFHPILFEGSPRSSGEAAASAGSSVSGRDLKQASLAPGSKPDHTTTLPLLESGRDTLTVAVWTNQSRHAQLINLRSDAGSLDGSGLPAGIPPSPEGKEAVARTAVMLEFVDESGSLLGDFTTTTEIGDSFAYNLRYELSRETLGLFHELGLDTAPGSDDFGFHYADTYEGTWTEDTGVEVDVRAGEGEDRVVTVKGLTKDLPGALAATTSDTPGGGAAGAAGECLIERRAPSDVTTTLRRFRDAVLLQTVPGRRLAEGYYAWMKARGSRPAE